MSNNPYPINSPSWNEWEKQVGRGTNQLPLPLGLEWDQDVEDIGLSQVVGDEDDDFLAGVSACGMSPEECEACQ